MNSDCKSPAIDQSPTEWSRLIADSHKTFKALEALDLRSVLPRVLWLDCYLAAKQKFFHDAKVVFLHKSLKNMVPATRFELVTP